MVKALMKYPFFNITAVVTVQAPYLPPDDSECYSLMASWLVLVPASSYKDQKWSAGSVEE